MENIQYPWKTFNIHGKHSKTMKNIQKAMENIQYPWKTFKKHEKHSINHEKHSINMENIQ